MPDCWQTHGPSRAHQAAPERHAAVAASCRRRDLNQDLIVAIAIARGIGEQPLLGGMTWGFGDDWIWQFRKVDDRIQIVRRNVRFRAAKGSPQEKAVHFAYTDSILFSLPIVTIGPGGELRGRSDAGVHERPAADFQRAAGLRVRRRPVELGGGQGLQGQRGDSKWRPPTPPAARSRSTPCPTPAA